MPFRQLKPFLKILIGVQYERRFYKFQFARNGHVQRAISTERLARLDTTVSLTGTSLGTYAIEPTCTEWYG